MFLNSLRFFGKTPCLIIIYCACNIFIQSFAINLAIVDKGNFSITTYYPPEPPLKHLLNPFRKNDIPQVPDFTIGMLIASARAGRWLYD
ncbi:hypothetical protein GEN14_00045 [Salmonella enterica]|nr:hypothetical protein [Salmonella enterica]